MQIRWLPSSSYLAVLCCTQRTVISCFKTALAKSEYGGQGSGSWQTDCLKSLLADIQSDMMKSHNLYTADFLKRAGPIHILCWLERARLALAGETIHNLETLLVLWWWRPGTPETCSGRELCPAWSDKAESMASAVAGPVPSVEPFALVASSQGLRARLVVQLCSVVSALTSATSVRHGSFLMGSSKAEDFTPFFFFFPLWERFVLAAAADCSSASKLASRAAWFRLAASSNSANLAQASWKCTQHWRSTD